MADPLKEAALANAWQRAVDQYRATAKWIVTAFATALVAALGTSPFLVLSEVDTPVEAVWTGWGLAAALAGCLVVIYVSSDLSTPVTISLGEFLRGIPEPVAELKSNIEEDLQAVIDAADRGAGAVTRSIHGCQPWTVNPDRNTLNWIDSEDGGSRDFGWRQHANVDQAVAWLIALERQRWFLDKQIDVILAKSNDDQTRIGCLKERRALIDQLFNDVAGIAASWIDRAAFAQVRARFRSSRATLLSAGALAAVGLIAFVGAARVDLSEQGSAEAPSSSLVADEAGGLLLLHDGEAAIELIAAQAGESSPCDAATALPVALLGGDGTAGSPWRVKGVSGAPCGAFELSLTSASGTVVAVDGEVRSDAILASVGVQPTKRQEIEAVAPGCDMISGSALMSWVGGDGSEGRPWHLIGVPGTACAGLDFTLRSTEGSVVGFEAIDDSSGSAGLLGRLAEPDLLAWGGVAWIGLLVVGVALALSARRGSAAR